MANRIFDLPQQRGAFQMRGVVSGVERSNFYSEKKTKRGGDFRSVFFQCRTGKDGAPHNISLNGMPRDKVYFFRSEDKAKGITKDKKEVAFKDRNTFVCPDGYSLVGIHLGLTQKESDGKMLNDKVTMVEYDACKYIADNLKDDQSVFIKGSTEFSSYQGKHQVRFTPNQISLCAKPIDFNTDDFKESANWEQNMVYTGIQFDKELGEAVISAKIVGYNTIEDAIFYLNPNDSDKVKKLMQNMKNKLKPYTSFTASGYMKAVEKVEEVVEDDGWGESNAMERQSSPVERKMYITGIDPSTFDTDTYTEEKMAEAQAKIVANAQAKADFNGKAKDEKVPFDMDDWGSAAAVSDDDDWA